MHSNVFDVLPHIAVRSEALHVRVVTVWETLLGSLKVQPVDLSAPSQISPELAQQAQLVPERVSGAWSVTREN